MYYMSCFFFKQKTAYEMRISDWSSDVCSSDLQTTFVHEFSKPLPGGVTCSFDLRDDLKSLSGYAIVGQRHFTVDSGGPVARAVLPSRYGSDIEEDQVFLVASNLTATRASGAAGAHCEVDGIGEKIAVDGID